MAIARALAKRPRLLLADEPTGNLDEETSSGVLELIRELNRETAASFVIVSHNPAIARTGRPRRRALARAPGRCAGRGALMLWRKAYRDLRAMGLRAVLIVIVIGAGPGTAAGIALAMHDVEATRDDFYSRYALADLDLRLRAPLPTTQLRDRAENAGARRAETRLILDGAAMQGGSRTAAEVVGMPVGAPLNRLAVTAGQGLDRAAPRGAAVDADYADRAGIHPGDRLRLRVAGRAFSVRVRGLARSPEYLLATANPDYLVPQRGSLAVVFLPRASLQRLTGLGGRANDLAVDLPGGGNGAAAKRLAAGLPTARVTPRSRQYGRRLTEADIHSFSIFAPVMGVVFGIVGLLLIALSLRRLVSSQRRELGALLAIGYPPRTVVGSVMLLAAALAALGAALAIAATIGVARLVANEYSSAVGFPDFLHPLAFGPLALAAGLAVARNAARRPPSRLPARPPGPDRGAARGGRRRLRAARLASAADGGRPAGAHLRAARAAAPPAAERRDRDQHRRRDRARRRAQHPRLLDQQLCRRDVRRPGLDALGGPDATAARRSGGGARQAGGGGPRRGDREGTGGTAGAPRGRRGRGPAHRAAAKAGPAAAQPDLRQRPRARSDRAQRADRGQARGRPRGMRSVCEPPNGGRPSASPASPAALPPNRHTCRGPRRRACSDSPDGRRASSSPAPRADARRLRADPAVARVTSKASALAAERELLDELTGLISVLQAISLGVGALFLVSTLALSYLDRRGEFATLAALGYGRRQIGAAVAGEALTQTLLAAALSVPLGILIASPLSQRIAEAWFEIGLHPEAPSFLLVILPALGLALLAAAHATRRALRLNIAATVRARLIG